MGDKNNPKLCILYILFNLETSLYSEFWILVFFLKWTMGCKIFRLKWIRDVRFSFGKKIRKLQICPFCTKKQVVRHCNGESIPVTSNNVCRKSLITLVSYDINLSSLLQCCCSTGKLAYWTHVTTSVTELVLPAHTLRLHACHRACCRHRVHGLLRRHGQYYIRSLRSQNRL